MKKLSMIIVLVGLILPMLAQQPTSVLKGIVTDPSGKSIPSAQVANAANAKERTITDTNGLYTLFTVQKVQRIRVSKPGFLDFEQAVGSATYFAVTLQPAPSVDKLEDVAIIEMDAEEAAEILDIKSIAVQKRRRLQRHSTHQMAAPTLGYASYDVVHNTEAYSPIDENIFHRAVDEPLSTFSADVDRASYANVRRFINLGQMPPVDAVRVEEMINYFSYDYESPDGDDPVKIFTEVSSAPWNENHYLMHIGIKARELDKGSLPPSNMVFLIDVSGSMGAPNKLPLLKSALNMLVDELRDEDRVALVVYAGAAGLVLESTPGHEKAKIKKAINNLSSGGSTAGGAGIKLAYKVAQQHFVEEGNNRVILATDGDFNVGASSDGEMQRLIEEKRKEDVFLTVLGFGMGNYKDSKMEILADKGNGNYAYIDNLMEAKKTLVKEFGSTLFTLAKDVKLQVEFNPETVGSYRLIGYENRKLNNEDFNDDTKDAGEMGVGHVVTALYEIIPPGSASQSKVDPLKYQGKQESPKRSSSFANELATVKVRYKDPDGEQSKLLSEIVDNDVKEMDMASINLKWSSSVAAFGMLLRGSKHKGNATYDSVIAAAKAATGKDEEGFRRECIHLMEAAERLDKNTASR